MTIETELKKFYERHGIGDVPGERPRTVPVYTGCLLVPLPNIEARRKFLKYHDIHHLITGYSVGRIGEGKISAWELGTGPAFVSPILGVMNLIALSTGLVLEPRRMWRAYERGCRSRNLYRAETRTDVDSERWDEVAMLRTDILEVKSESTAAPVRAVAFSVYAILAMFIHACLAISAVIARFFTDVIGSGSVFEALKPSSRTDLYRNPVRFTLWGQSLFVSSVIASYGQGEISGYEVDKYDRVASCELGRAGRLLRFRGQSR